MNTIKTHIPATNGALADQLLAPKADDNATTMPDLGIPAFLKVENRPKPTENAMPAQTAPATAKKAAPVTPPKKATVAKAKPNKPTTEPRKPEKPAKATKAAPAKGIESKTEMVGRLLRRKDGCTTAEILAETSWPAVSVPQLAKANHLKLRKEKVKGQPTRYFGA